ncbi:HlyD family secretion protein [Pseudonocardia thermophila]|jgi:Multidrug resistance efflux pump|uniref:HlyD family secretion protein n=1 Tax=Pseudonocardia thermophila TaxID=1848 RepID=A0A1M6N597_PSETH|nr:HlyD family efflux transporter periplasmic adaptor subunit [Pseudonocardia thermophila]SHJ90796.1 HlyD family secretion protein [Pseudonocardia thermophila]
MDARHARSGGGFVINRTRVLAAATALVGVVGIGAVACTAAESDKPRTATVERATLTTGVSAPGALTAITEQNLGFPKGGQLTSVLVKVGDRVEAGQVLATVDDFAAKQVLKQQEAQLAAQEAALARITDSPAVSGAENTLAQAQQILEATEDSVEAMLEADDVSIGAAERQLSADKNALRQAEAKAAASCGSGRSSASYDDADDDDTGWPRRSTSLLTSPSCTADQQAVAAAKQQVAASKAALEQAEQKREIDEANGRVQIENARQAVVSAQNNLDSTSADRPHSIDQQAALVAAARAAVEQARRDVENCTLRAPVAGTVAVINGTVGEYLAPSTGTSALAPGSDAPIPGAGGATGGGAAAAATGVSANRPGGTQFIVLSDVDQFQVVVPFNESDAVQIQPGQRADVTFDAIPDLTAPGSVLSVAPVATSIGGVISYYATITLNSDDPRLKSGLTATANVITGETEDVLTVPSSAVRNVDGRSVVTVLGPNGPADVPFQPGQVGLDRTEVVSGLQEGQQVLLPVGQ